MKKFLVASFVLAFSLQAADKMEYINIQETLDSALAKETLSGKISFSFGSKSGNGKVIAKDLVTNKKSNAAMRGHDGKIESCKRSFISALKQFEDRAMRENGTKVIHLISYFTKKPYDSTTEFECATGTWMTGVALKGDVAK